MLRNKVDVVLTQLIDFKLKQVTSLLEKDMTYSVSIRSVVIEVFQSIFNTHFNCVYSILFSLSDLSFSDIGLIDAVAN